MPVTPVSRSRAQVGPIQTPFQRGNFDSGGRAIGEATAQAGRQLAQTGQRIARTVDSIMEANERLAQREDAVKRIQAIGQLQDEFDQLVTAERDQGQNFGTMDATRAFRADLDQAAQKLSGQLDWQSRDGGLRFQEMVEELKGRYHRFATDEGHKENVRRLGEAVSQRITRDASVVATNPDAADDVLTGLDIFISENFDPQATPAQSASVRRTARAAVAKSMISYYADIARDTQKARAVLSDPRFAGSLQPEEATKIIVGLHRQDAQAIDEKEKLQVRYRFLKDTMGLTDEQLSDPRVALAITTNTGLSADPRAPRTPLDKLNEFTKVMSIVRGEPYQPTAQDVQRVYGTYRASDDRGVFGRGTTDLGMGVADLTDKLTSQAIDEKEFDRLFMGIRLLTAPDRFGNKTELDPVTRRKLRDMGVEPEQLGTAQGEQQVEALRQRLFSAQERQDPDLGGVEERGFDIGGGFQLGNVSQTPGGGQLMQPNPQAMIDVLQQVVERQEQPAEPGQTPDAELGAVARSLQQTGYSMFQVAPAVAGLPASIVSGVSYVYLLGRVLDASEVNTLRMQHRTFIPMIVEALRRSLRNVDKERQDLMSGILSYLETAAFKDPDYFQDQVVGLDNALITLQAEAEEAIANPTSVQPDTLKLMTDRLKTIETVRAILGVPRADTPEEYAELVDRLNLRAGDYVVYRGVRRRILRDPTPAGEGSE